MRLLFLILLNTCLSVCLSSCANPAGSLQPDIDRFKRDYSTQSQTYPGRSRQMHYVWSGDPNKRAILFVHGSPGSWEGWVRFLLNPELQKNFQLIAIDRPGFGESGRGITETSVAAQAADVIDVLKINKSSQAAILVGHSFGGPVIARMAMDYPERVAGLVFVASSVSPDLEHIKWFQYPGDWWPIRELIPSELKVCNQEIFPLKAELTAMLPLWKKIKAKAVLIQGEADDLVPPGNLDFLMEKLDPRLVVKVMRIAGLNHFIPWKRPDLILNGIQTLDEVLETQ